VTLPVPAGATAGPASEPVREDGPLATGTEALVREARERAARPLGERERLGEALAALGFFCVAVATVVLFGFNRPLDVSTAAVLVGGFAVASRIRFEVGAGHTNPTQLLFVPMLFLLPMPMVPLLVVLANLLGELPEYLSRRRHPQRVLVTVADSWYVVGPVLVLLLTGTPEASSAAWPLLVAAMGSQVLVDLGTSAIRERFEFGVPPRLQLADGWYLAIDLLLAVIGLGVVLRGPGTQDVFLLVLPILAVAAIFADQRRRGLQSALELSDAYRGATTLLAEVIEHDDHYTGAHSQSVVSLCLQVADEMALDPRQRRNLEFAALLHDLGKLAVPKQLINKKGPLDEEEWAVMKLHTLTGERLLRKIGGRFEEVARIVRSSHERWDGTGYPDGLAGVTIPIEARIVACCDAFDAMTSDRAYRRALDKEAAVAQLREHAGTQFDPGVVWIVIRVAEESAHARPGEVVPLHLAARSA
jgi:hypothetical protein